MKNNKTPKNDLTKKSRSVETRKLEIFFIVFFLACLFVSATLAAASGGDSWKSMLFHNGPYTDMYMDFFNSIRDAGAEDVYTARNNIYPPLCLLLFKVMGFLISDTLVDLPNVQRTQLQSDQRSMMVYILFACVCLLAMTTLINSYVNKIKWKNNNNKVTLHTVLSFILIISYPVMYCIERGNIIILSMILTMFFIFFRDSDNKFLKECSYISLALAAGIKLYPAIFGILLLFEKKYKDAARLVVYGIVATVLPFVFFITPESEALSLPIPTLAASISNNSTMASITDSSSPIANILENLLSFATNKKSRLNFSSVSIQNFVFIFSPQNTMLAKIVCYITEAIAVLALFFVKRKWQQVFLVSYLMLNIPSASSSYALTFLIIPFIMFLYDDEGNGYSDKKRPTIDWLYTAGYALLFAPLPILWYFHQDVAKEIFNSFNIAYQSKINQVVAGFVFQYMFAFIISEVFSITLKTKISNKRAKKNCTNIKNTETNVTNDKCNEVT